MCGGMICTLRNSGPARFGQFFQRQALAALPGGLDQVEVIVGRDAAADPPRMCSRVGDAEIIGDVFDRWPDVSDVLHDAHTTQYAQFRSIRKWATPLRNVRSYDDRA